MLLLEAADQLRDQIHNTNTIMVDLLELQLILPLMIPQAILQSVHPPVMLSCSLETLETTSGLNLMEIFRSLIMTERVMTLSS